MNTQPEYHNARPKPQTLELPKYLKWLRSQRCVSCGASKTEYLDIVPAHPSGGGMAKKEHDSYALPLCVNCHAFEHRNPKTFWNGIDRYRLIAEHLTQWWLIERKKS